MDQSQRSCPWRSVQNGRRERPQGLLRLRLRCRCSWVPPRRRTSLPRTGRLLPAQVEVPAQENIQPEVSKGLQEMLKGLGAEEAKIVTRSWQLSDTLTDGAEEGPSFFRTDGKEVSPPVFSEIRHANIDCAGIQHPIHNLVHSNHCWLCDAIACKWECHEGKPKCQHKSEVAPSLSWQHWFLVFRAGLLQPESKEETKRQSSWIHKV
ncbi:uncharacterized protein [Heliangelus exortis]|uniref:uncharacterized protein n=1 Tax=Heliangelus exortis TaxID=472823 RepID=UPI003A8F5277